MVVLLVAAGCSGGDRYGSAEQRALAWIDAAEVELDAAIDEDGGDADDGGTTDGPIDPEPCPCDTVEIELDELLEDVEVLDATTTIAWRQAVEVELTAIDAIDDEVLEDLCPGDWLELGDALEDLSNLPIAADVEAPLRDELLDLQADAWDQLDHASDLVYRRSGASSASSWIQSCSVSEWSRLQPYEDSGLPDFTGCQVLAMTQRAGLWYHQGSVAPVMAGSFGTWERSTNDYGQTLYPTRELLEPMDGITDPYSDVDVMTSPGGAQFHSTLKLAALKPAIAQYGTAYIVYGRTNSTSVQVYTPKLFVDDGVGIEYEYGPRRDSVKILGCPASELLPWEELSFGNRQANEVPWFPFVPAQPSMWAVVAVCPPQDPPPIDAGTGPDAADDGDGGGGDLDGGDGDDGGGGDDGDGGCSDDDDEEPGPDAGVPDAPAPDAATPDAPMPDAPMPVDAGMPTHDARTVGGFWTAS